eukprot:TRINITY_DN1825_c0_g2_i8.p1 TRINITY_DN1825_c0_g2~~TRINITY_DN1825_c0_g2_i8.p1  ORF type:complete len:250 (+),score=62.78 TRINITY_DN1825_c0_g2_i8:135-884(+)
MKLENYPRRLILKSLAFKNIRYNNSDLKEELKKLLRQSDNTFKAAEKNYTILIESSKMHRHYIKHKEARNMMEVRRSLKKFALEQLKSAEAVNEFFSRSELRDNVNQLKPEELAKGICFIKEMIMVKAEEENEKSQWTIEPFSKKGTSDTMVTLNQTSTFVNLPLSKLGDYFASQQSNRRVRISKRMSIDKNLSCDYRRTGNETQVSDYKFPVLKQRFYRSRKDTSGRFDLIIKAVSYTHLTLPTNREV